MIGLRRCVLSMLWVVPCLVMAGEAELKPPFVGEVTGTRVRIRAGGSVNYGILAVAEKGQRVQVREVREGWFGIAIPDKCTVWVSKTLLTLEPDGKQATVAKDKVNIRARGNSMSDVIGQLAQGTKVKIVDNDGDWCGIVAPPEVTAWIDGHYVRKVEGAAVTEPARVQIQEPVKEPGKETAKEPGKETAKEAPKEGTKEVAKEAVPAKTVEVSEASALLRKAQERYAAELAKPPKERDFGEVLSMYQKVATECGDPEVARQAEGARQRLLKIVDIHQALQAARVPVDQFEKKYNGLEEEFMRKVEGAPKEPKEKVEEKSENKGEPKSEVKPEPKVEPKSEPKPEPKAEEKEPPKDQPKGETKGDVKPEEKQP